MSKLQKGLIAVLVVQVVLIAIVFWPKPQMVENREFVLGERMAEEVNAIRVADVDGNIVDMQKTDGAWGLVDADQYPVDASKVNTMLEDLFAVQYGRLVAENESSHARLEVGENAFNRRITLSFDSGETQTIYVGSTPSAASTNFRLDGEEAVYLSDQLNSYAYGTTKASWINTSLVLVSADSVQAMQLTNENGEINFQLQDDGTWTLDALQEGESANSEAISTLLSHATGLTVKEPLGESKQAAYGMDNPTATVVLTMVDEEDKAVALDLVFGAVDAEAGTVVVKSSASRYYVKVNSTGLEDILSSSAADFVTVAETEAATPQS